MNGSSSTPQKRRLIVCNGAPIGKKVVVGFGEETKQKEIDMKKVVVGFGEETEHKENEIVQQTSESEKIHAPVKDFTAYSEDTRSEIELSTSKCQENVDVLVLQEQKKSKEPEVTKELVDHEIEQWNIEEHNIKLKMIELNSSFDDLIEKEKMCAGKSNFAFSSLTYPIIVQIAQMTAELLISADPLIPTLLEECEKLMQDLQCAIAPLDLIAGSSTEGY